MHKLLITDLDNTLYNWVDYFAPRFRSIVHVIAKQTSIDEETIYTQFKHVFAKYGALEYSFSVQELSLCKNLPVADVERLVNFSKFAFSRTRNKRLIPYAEVQQTLSHLQKRGLKIVGVTNAPIYHAQMRLKQLKIEKLFYGLAGWEGHAVPDDDISATKIVKHRSSQGWYKTKIKKIWVLPKELLKPDTNSYLKIINEIGCTSKQCVVIGDSIQKDLVPALEHDIMAVWAKYGRDFNGSNFETLLKITDWSEEKVQSTYFDDSIVPSYTIDCFSQLTKIIFPPQMSIFDL